MIFKDFTLLKDRLEMVLVKIFRLSASPNYLFLIIVIVDYGVYLCFILVIYF